MPCSVFENDEDVVGWMQTRLLLAARLFNANCILSRLFLPSLIAFARKTSSSFPQVVLPAFFPAILVGINR